MKYLKIASLAAGLLIAAASQAPAATSVTQNGITWTFAQDHEVGTFVTGDYWVKGPVTIISITNDLNAAGFTPKPGQNGSMINPTGVGRQGYEPALNNYSQEMNAGMPGGKPLGKDNPLELKPNQTLISMVSWLYNSPDETEPGSPRFNGGTNAPRPATRSAAVLTCVTEAPAEGSFRPPYCGDDKTIKYNKKNLKTELLKKLPPVADTPDVKVVEARMSRTWIDHVHEYLGAMVHPSEHMPNYGRDMAHVMNNSALMLQLDFDAIPGKPTKDKILINLVQYGIDLAGIADNKGGWPANGGHHLGRKWPILFAGLMLDDAHMKNVGQWETEFHEDDQTFYVTEKEVKMSHSDAWSPDKRAPAVAYEEQHIGMPEWGIRHATKPRSDNRSLQATYRSINGEANTGFVLAALIMGQKKAWNHDALFDYTDRYMALLADGKVKQSPPPFVMNMWNTYRKDLEQPAKPWKEVE